MPRLKRTITGLALFLCVWSEASAKECNPVLADGTPCISFDGTDFKGEGERRTIYYHFSNKCVDRRINLWVPGDNATKQLVALGPDHQKGDAVCAAALNCHQRYQPEIDCLSPPSKAK